MIRATLFRCGAAVLVFSAAAAEPLRSGFADMSRDLQSMQRDDAANPGLLWALDGGALWNEGARSCASCHGDIANMPSVYQENTLQMEWCLSCHRDPAPNIRPKSEIYNTSWSKDDITPEQQKKVDEKIKTLRSKEMLTSC